MKQEERTRRKESGGRVGLVGKVGALTERGMEKEFELRRIRLAVAVVVRWTGGLAGIEGSATREGAGRCGFARGIDCGEGDRVEDGQ